MHRLKAAVAIAIWFAAKLLFSQIPATPPTVGLHEAKPSWLLIQNASIHPSTDVILEQSSLLVHNTKIVGIGANLVPPEGCQIIDGTGKHIYPGLIDAYLPVTAPEISPPDNAHWNTNIRPDRDLSRNISFAEAKISERRKAGFSAALFAPNSGIVQGQSAVYLLTDSVSPNSLVRGNVGMHLQLTTRFGFGRGERPEGGPTSPMGAFALARQTMLDASWYRDAWQVAAINPEVPRPETNDSLLRLKPVINGEMPIVVSTTNELFGLRAARFAREFGLRLLIVGNGNEYRRLSEIVDLNVPIILPIDFPDAPKLGSAQDVLNVSLEDLMHWDHAPENPARLVAGGATVAFTTLGLENPGDFWTKLRTAVKRGLPEDRALDAVTSVPAELLGVSDQLGTLEKGKLASFFISDGPIFDEKSKIVSNCVAGTLFDFDPPPVRKFDGLWEIETDLAKFFVTIHSKPKLSVSASSQRPDDSSGDGSEIKNAAINDVQLTGTLDAKEFDASGTWILSFTLDSAEEGNVILLDENGAAQAGTAIRLGDAPRPKKSDRHGGEDQPNEADESKTDKTPDENLEDSSIDQDSEAGVTSEEKTTKPTDDERKLNGATVQPALYPVNYPFGDFGRLEPPAQPRSVLFHNVTIWTCGEHGNIEGGSVFVQDGLIAGVFSAEDEMPEAEWVVDGSGMHLTPGIIDCHSHMATDSGVNEVGQAITAEVRIGDFIDCDDITIYRQLAGGVTAANILHGSANPIGGQNQVIKLRWGLNDEQLKFAEAPQGIKFALGENVKQSGSREPSTRYPQTRMGVEQLMHDTFGAAQVYQEQHATWKKNRTGLPPRVDLEMEAISEILDGKRWIHCHSYRQDEILALIRVLDEYGITIGSFQHVLEGYKVADAIAKHGGTASSFSDWWAYKYEVIDAIPFGGAIMHNAGIVVSFNSDDGELARHLNHEAAKAVRYGGVSESEALKFVTLNPAIQLRIDEYVGSIEEGKHADLVLWSGHPLALTSRCEQTWIDGRKYFDRGESEELAIEQSKQKSALVQRALKAGDKSGKRRGREDDSSLWPRFDEYCHGHDHEHE